MSMALFCCPKPDDDLKYNEGALVGEWVKFPTTAEELQKVFERIGIGSKDDFGHPYEEWFITDYDCYVDGLYEMLGEYENLDELNYLASKLEELDDHDYEHFQAAMQVSDYTGSVKDLINLINNLDKYEIYPGVDDYSDLGRYYIDEVGVMEIPEHLANYIDYEAYGRDVAIDEMGQFTNYGYVRDTQESFTEYYDGDRESIPDEYRVFGTAEKSEEKTSVLKDLKEKQKEASVKAQVNADEFKDYIDMSEDMLRRSRILVVCGTAVDETVLTDIAIANRFHVASSTMRGVISVDKSKKIE